MHVEQAGDGEAAASIHRHRPAGELATLSRADPPDTAVVDQERRFRAKSARGKVQHPDPLEQYRRRRWGSRRQPDGDLFPRAARERLTPQSVAGDIEQCGTVRREAELGREAELSLTKRPDFLACTDCRAHRSHIR